jgi:hypothetical protein
VKMYVVYEAATKQVFACTDSRLMALEVIEHKEFPERFNIEEKEVTIEGFDE